MSSHLTLRAEAIAGAPSRKSPRPTRSSWPRGCHLQPPFALLDTARLLDTAKIGTLKSFDCRNIHNVAYLPPTGTGTPPCIEMQPSEFEGRSKLYPRLELDPP